MPVTNQGTPTVQVSVPVPSPVQPQQQRQAPPKPRPAKRPTRVPQDEATGQEKEGSQAGTSQQVTAQMPPPVPVPRAIILPWAPNTGGQQRMARLPRRVIKMAAAEPGSPLGLSQHAISASRDARPRHGPQQRRSPRHRYMWVNDSEQAYREALNGNHRAAADLHEVTAEAHRGWVDYFTYNHESPGLVEVHRKAAEAHEAAAKAHHRASKSNPGA